MEAAIAVARRGLEADPPEPPPRGIVPLLGFKRFPDRALEAARKVLEDDPAFRTRVRDTTTEEMMGRASWLFLDRPEGWEEELAELAAAAEDAADAAQETKAEASLRRRVAALESSLERSGSEVVRLRAEMAGSKESLAAERRARRLAESDAGRLRRQAVALASEVDELRHRQADLEEALDSAGRPPEDATEATEDATPPVPDVDHLALADLIADGARAAEALSEALAAAEELLAPALAPPTPPPGSPAPERGGSSADSRRRRPTALPPGTFDDSVEAADHLVRTAGTRVLVDGYNVTKSAHPELALAEQRRWLADAAGALAARTGAQLELVFDGADDRASAPADRGRRQGVQMRFSAEGTEADDVILELVEELPPSVPVVVASDDRRVRDGARRRGANVVSGAQLLAVLGYPPS